MSGYIKESRIVVSEGFFIGCYIFIETFDIILNNYIKLILTIII